MTHKPSREIPDINQLKAELSREKYKRRYGRVLRSTICFLVVVAAVSLLVATQWMPVFQIYGNAMSPTLEEGQIVLAVNSKTIEPGDLAAFYVGNKLLVRRVIAGPNDVVNLSEEATVHVNGARLSEPYLSRKARGICDITFPYQVPDTHYFLLGDNRESSVDSRSSIVGCVTKEQFVGKIVFCVWPLGNFGIVAG